MQLTSGSDGDVAATSLSAVVPPARKCLFVFLYRHLRWSFEVSYRRANRRKAYPYQIRVCNLIQSALITSAIAGTADCEAVRHHHQGVHVHPRMQPYRRLQDGLQGNYDAGLRSVLGAWIGLILFIAGSSINSILVHTSTSPTKVPTCTMDTKVLSSHDATTRIPFPMAFRLIKFNN